MEFKSEQKYILLSPRKVRPVADLVRKMTPKEAVEKLPFIKKRASEPFLKVVKAAMAAAKEKGFDENSVVFKEIQIGEGPRLKRGRPVSRGRWHPIKKRMSHIKVILESVKKAEKVDKKEVAKDTKKEVKKEKNDTKKKGTKK